MPLDQNVIGKQLPSVTMTINAGRLRFVAKAIGETNPVFTDLQTANAAGHRDLPVPPPSCSASNWNATTRSSG